MKLLFSDQLDASDRTYLTPGVSQVAPGVGYAPQSGAMVPQSPAVPTAPTREGSQGLMAFGIGGLVTLLAVLALVVIGVVIYFLSKPATPAATDDAANGSRHVSDASGGGDSHALTRRRRPIPLTHLTRRTPRPGRPTPPTHRIRRTHPQPPHTQRIRPIQRLRLPTRHIRPIHRRGRTHRPPISRWWCSQRRPNRRTTSNSGAMWYTNRGGIPTNPDGCQGPYFDKGSTLKRLTVEVIVINNSKNWIPDKWMPTFISASGANLVPCIWYYNNTVVEPGEMTDVTFATHLQRSRLCACNNVRFPGADGDPLLGTKWQLHPMQLGCRPTVVQFAVYFVGQALSLPI